MERQLATIQRITEINPIEGADRIEVASVRGWKVVINKNIYSVGDLVTFCEIDSFVPHTLAPFLTKDGHYPKVYEGVEGERLRTVKLRSQISQGLILPAVEGYSEGADVSDVLGIVKYDPPLSANLVGVALGNFPSFIPKTDEVRIQNLGALLTAYEGTPMYITEKIDGSSATYFYRDGEFGVCSRNLELKETEGNAYWAMARELGLEKVLALYGEMGENLALQGELAGKGIQGNPLGLDKLTFFVYNVFNINDGTYLSLAAAQELIEFHKLQMVPLIETDHVLQGSTEYYVDRANGMKSVLNPKVLAEGIVCRPMKEITTRYGRLSYKAINNKYLLKQGE